MAGREERVSDIEIMQAFIYSRDPVLAAKEVAEDVGMTPQGVTYRLKKLEEDGLIASKKPGRDRMWWLTEKGRDYLASRR